jgi:predicted transcriptional regulator
MDNDFSEDKPQFDLFGNLIEPLRDRRGRPSFSKSKENQDFVTVRSAAGWTQENISEALGCDLKTMRKHFSLELQAGALILEGLQLDVLMQRTRQGHVPSIKELRAITEKGRLRRHPAPTKEPKADVPGKKEQRIRDAQHPSGSWGEVLNTKGDVH